MRAAAREGGMKAGSRMAARLVVKGTAANYTAYEGTRTAGWAVDVDESVDYVVDDVLGPRFEDLLDEDLDPLLRALLTDRLEQSLTDRLDLDTRVQVSETNTVIARRIAEHHAFEAIFRRVSPG